MLTTVTNETLQIRRQAHRKREFLTVEDTDSGWMPEFVGGHGQSAKDQLRRVWQAIAELPDENREVVLLFAAGYEYPEIAEMLDIAVSTVRSHICSARRRLPRKTDDDGEED
jgi:RNA polymerase sigma factor (sigma-70 family)